MFLLLQVIDQATYADQLQYSEMTTSHYSEEKDTETSLDVFHTEKQLEIADKGSTPTNASKAHRQGISL